MGIDLIALLRVLDPMSVNGTVNGDRSSTARRIVPSAVVFVCVCVCARARVCVGFDSFSVWFFRERKGSKMLSLVTQRQR